MLSRLSLLVCLVVLFSASPARASSGPSEATLAQNFPSPPIRAAAAVVMDAGNGAVLASLNAHRRLPMASTTKIMTGLLALQLGKLSDRIVVPRAAFNYESDATIMGLKPGETVTLRDLLYGLLLPSGADAANTIAIHYGGSETHFVAMMNHEAAVLGLHDTHYVDATGLSSRNHYSSAYDLAVLGQYVSYIPDFVKISSTRTYRWNGHVLQNVNHVLFWYPGVDGVKPGYTYEAGICQVIDDRRDGRHVVVTLLNTPDLVIDARNLLNFGLRDFTWVQSQQAAYRLPGDGPMNAQSGVTAGGRYLYFPASGHYLRGPFLAAFQANGGLAVLGFPRTEPLHEGRLWVQYLQNGALAWNPSNHQVTPVALGKLSSPLPRATPTPLPTPTPRPTATPHEGVIVPQGSGTPTPHRTSTPRPRVTPTTTPTPTPTPLPPGAFATGNVFQPFQKARGHWLGAAVSAVQSMSHYQLQYFTYGALLADLHAHAVYVLPLGDRWLGARHFLPAHPGNVYPSGFAPAAALKAIGWPAIG